MSSAIMQAFRSNAKVVMTLVAVLFVVFFLVIDLSGIGSGTSIFSRSSVGKINGQSVDVRVYQDAVQAAYSQRQRQSDRQLTEEDQEAVRDQVWNSFVDDLVLSAEYKRYGLTVSDEEIAQAVQTVPPQELVSQEEFQTDGRFDPTKYQRWLSSAVGQQFVPLLEQRYRGEIFRSKLLQIVTADLYLSDAALWQRWKDEYEQVRVGIAAILPRTAVPDSAVTVTDADIEQYYTAHRKELERPASAWLSYVAVPRFLTASDSAAARERALRIRQEIVDGAPFAEVAQRESSDPVSARQGGDLGTFGHGAMVPAFDSAAFSLPLNTLSEPVETQFGIHIIEVTARTADSVTARHVLIPFELAGAHRDTVEALADSLEQLGADRLDPAALDSAARALGRPILQAGPVQKGTRVQVGRFVVPDAGIWAFRAKPGETSPVIETEMAYYLFRVDSARQAGIPALADVRAEVERAARDEKKVATARPMAEALVKRVREGSTLADAAAAVRAPYREFGPFPRVRPPVGDPVLVGTAFGLPAGGTSDPVETEGGLQVITVLQRLPADSAAFRAGLDQWRVQQVRLAQQDRVRNYLETLRTTAKVEDHREELFRTTAQAEADAGALPIQGRRR